MEKQFIVWLLLIFTMHSHAFDSSWIAENVHDGCSIMESKEFISNSESWSTEAEAYGEAIGATNALVDSDKRTPNGWQYNVSYYKCPENCTKSGASEENGMLGKENLLSLIEYKPIECGASLAVPDFLLIDFDNDGFKGYAIRYKTIFGGYQGQQGHLCWDVAFIKNTNGKLSKLDVKHPNIEGPSCYHNLIVNKNNLVIQYYTMREDEVVNKNYHLRGNVLYPTN